MPLLLLLLLSAAWPASAQFGLQDSDVSVSDFQFPQYAQPWEVGQNVCAFLRTADGRRIFTTCHPYKQKVCGADTQFEYDCCPGYGHDSEFEGYARGPNWQRGDNCLRLLGDEDTRASNGAYLRRLGADDAVAGKLRTDLAATSDQVTAFVPFNDTYSSVKDKLDAASFIVSGSYYSKHLLEGSSLAVAGGGGGSVKITRYSNGIVCAECQRLVSADHTVDGRAVLHLVDGLVQPSQQSLASVLESQFAHFWADVPAEERKLLQGDGCGGGRWLTVLAPSAAAWATAKAKVGGGGTAELVREHILSQLICAAAVCQDSVANENLNGESARLGCDERGTFAQSTHEFVPNEKVHFLPTGGQVGSMAANGVVYATDGALLHSAGYSFGELDWPDVPDSCVQLDPDKKYIFLIPTKAAWQRFRSSTLNVSSEQSMKSFSDRYDNDAEYRCLVKRYHVLEADDTDLQRLWSQHNPTASPQAQPGSFRTLAKWPGAKQAAYGFLRNHLHFQKSDTGPRLHFQFAPVRGARGFALRQGSGYLLDWPCLPPEENAADFFARRSDLASHKKLVDAEAKAAAKDGRRGLYDTEASVQLIVVSKDAWYEKRFSDVKPQKNVKTRIDALMNSWNSTDFLRLNWGRLYFWIGDLGFMARGERVYIRSGHDPVHLAVYRHPTTGEFFLWQEFRDSPETIADAQKRWLQIVEFNHFKTDAIVWIVDKPLLCSKRLCEYKISGKIPLPWSLATACGDFVTLNDPQKLPLSMMRKKVGKDMNTVVELRTNLELTSGHDKGKTKEVSCFGAGMLYTKDFVFKHEDLN